MCINVDLGSVVVDYFCITKIFDRNFVPKTKWIFIDSNLLHNYLYGVANMLVLTNNDFDSLI